MKEYKNYIFDLYGTLADIHTDEWEPTFWQQVSVYFAKAGAIYQPEELQAAYYKEIEQQRQTLPAEAEVDLAPVFASLYEQKGIAVPMEEIGKTAETFRKLSMKKLRLFDGTEEMLDRLRKAGKKIYLLSNAQALFTAPELRELGLIPWFDGILLSSDAGYKKPSGRFYQMLLDRYELEPAESVMVGNDDEADCHGAAEVGLDSMYIFTEQSPKRVRPLPENCRELASIAEVF